MKWAAYSSVFLMGTVKFMFAPFAGRGMNLPLLETVIVSCAGAIFSSAIFYYSSRYFMERHRQKILSNTETLPPLSKRLRKRKINKAVVKMKRTLGKIGICFYAPLLLSIPIGSIICAKFYNHSQNTFPLMVMGMLINATLLSILAYYIF